jgi:hypothetical protein
LAWCGGREARRRLSLIVLRHMPALMLETAADLVMAVLGSVYALASVYVLALIVWGLFAH